MFQWLWCSSHNVTIYEVRCSLIRCYRPPPFIQILKYFQHKYYYLILYWSNLVCLNRKDVVEKGFLWNARCTKKIICFYLNISCQLLNNYEFSHFHKKMFACNYFHQFQLGGNSYISNIYELVFPKVVIEKLNSFCKFNFFFKIVTFCFLFCVGYKEKYIYNP